VISPGVSDEQIAGETMKKEGFEKKDLNVNVNMLRVAESLNSQVDMSESELRGLLKQIFETAPSFHINSVARLAKKGKKESRMEKITRMSGGLI